MGWRGVTFSALKDVVVWVREPIKINKHSQPLHSSSLYDFLSMFPVPSAVVLVHYRRDAAGETSGSQGASEGVQREDA